jgi:arylsulfatase
MDKQTRPNILVILSDQHRYDCTGAYGNTQVRTPHLDGLAQHSIVFDAAACPFPVCAPSRYSLLTSLYPRQHTAWKNGASLPPGIPTFPRAFQQAGYHTSTVGKMHLTPTYADVGFGDMVLAEQDGPGRHDDDYHRYLRSKGLIDRNDLTDQVGEFREKAPEEYWRTFGATASNLPEEEHSTSWIANRAIDAISNWGDEPQLLFTSFIKPHHPFDPPASWAAEYPPDDIEILPGWLEELPSLDAARGPGYFPNTELTQDSMRRVTAHYYATISHMDHHIGRILAKLKETRQYDNTIIVYTSDHGELMGFHHLLLKHNYMYEPLVRVPLFMKLPGQQDGGTRSASLTSLLDLAPTLARLSGVELSGSIEGKDMFADPEREFLFAEFDNELMVRTRDYKLLLMKNSEQCQLFDLTTDSSETENRYADPEYVEVRRRLEDAARKKFLFEAWPPMHGDQDAPSIDSPNALGPLGEHRNESRAYFRGKMRALGEKT